VSTLDVIVHVLHVVSAATWLGAAIFVGWFLMPALIEAGPDGGKVMNGVQRRGWVAVAPVIAVLTVVSGIYLYIPYMGSPSTMGSVLGAGGTSGSWR
jgi:putative copper export protein